MRKGRFPALKKSINRELANAMIIINRVKKLDKFITLLQNAENRLTRLNVTRYQSLNRGCGTTSGYGDLIRGRG